MIGIYPTALQSGAAGWAQAHIETALGIANNIFSYPEVGCTSSIQFGKQF